ncbi:MAG: FHA domain-containing protein [Pseudanabaenaceae cyanobacterium bins.68]|nr:FHA domain-containing protein [Pseudanabaenaceae cyanobacterium bins.68]
MITCPSCLHQNPDHATQCEACYMFLPVVAPELVEVKSPELDQVAQEKSACPNCGTEVVPGASFCGNCGFDLRLQAPQANNPPNIPVVELPSTTPKTQLQQTSVYLFHVQTETKIEIPASKLLIHLGKPNNLITPDIDLSGLPDSDIVSRVHGDIRNEGDAYYFEDTGSSNGTYINNVPLPPGNRHRLRAGDRISLGKGDRVSFIFQVNA